MSQKTLKNTGSFVGSRQVRIGANATVMTIVFLAILVLVNIIAMRNHKRWDLTATGEFSLSQQTIQIIDTIDQPVQIIGFFPKDNPMYQEQQDEVASKLKEYTSRSKHISYRVVDPDVDIITTQNYAISSYGTIVFESGENRQKLFAHDEQDITGALLKVTQEEATTIYFLTGHRERTIDGFDQKDYGDVKSMLQQDNFNVEAINLVITDTIPLDNSVLVVADPQDPLQPNEEDIIADYVAQGGRLMVLGNPLNPAPLQGLFDTIGLTWNDDVIIDQQSEMGNPLAPAVVDYPFHTITKDLQQIPTLFATVRTISQVGSAPSELTISPIVQSSERSQAATDFSEDGEIRPSQTDAKGPLSFGYAIEGAINAGGAESAQADARIVVIGDADFASNSYTRTPGIANAGLFHNAIAWLAAQEELISLPEKEQVDRSLFLDKDQSNFVFYSSTLGLPLLVLIGGLVIWLRRR